MSYSLEEINENVLKRPEEFVLECDKLLTKRISKAADSICDNMSKSPIVLLSGPSGSGKTTTARKLGDELTSRGVKAYSISMDNYFKTLNLRTAPRTPEGDVDFESPECMDMKLLSEHFSALSAGQEIRIPYFMFSRQKRSASKFTKMRLADNEIAIFEGIHAFNDDITERHPEAFKLYISTASNIKKDGEKYFRHDWMRLVRRVVRDDKFRGADAGETLGMWPNVLRGEKAHILPYKYKADYTIDSSLPYELPVMREHALPLFRELGDENELGEYAFIPDALESFESLSSEYVPQTSLIREFIGGGIYEY